MHPKLLLRGEGLVITLFAVGAFYILGGPWWLFLVLFLAPDLSMLGYLAGPRYGSFAYNAFHSYIGPAAVGALGLWLGIEVVVLVTLIWTAHIGADRLVGYGLKYPTSFKDTHLSRLATRSEQNQDPVSVTPAD